MPLSMGCRRLPFDFSDLDFPPRKRARLCPARRTPVHPASQVDYALHTTAIVDLISLDITPAVKEYIVDVACDAVDLAIDDPASCNHSGALWARPDKHFFSAFASNVIDNSGVAMPVLLVALVYLRRARGQLRIDLDEWAYHRVFLGALIAAAKYTNDTSPKAAHWSAYTGTFGRRDISLIEREFLGVLDFHLGITEDDILAHYDALLAPPAYAPDVCAADMFALSAPSSRAGSPLPELEPSSAWSPDSEFPSPITPPSWAPHSSAPAWVPSDVAEEHGKGRASGLRSRAEPVFRSEPAFHEATRGLRATMPLRLPQPKARHAQLLCGEASRPYSEARAPYGQGRQPRDFDRLPRPDARHLFAEARGPSLSVEALYPRPDMRFLRTDAPLLDTKFNSHVADHRPHVRSYSNIDHVILDDDPHHIPVILHGRTRSQISFLDCL
uniref:Cyclin N-terminal domain-containing protein n=2 Tax=Schizophyllum commune (strain H4-8 / FGSC 9210) TaxID=578458 RepID=D8PXB2_SCHCM